MSDILLLTCNLLQFQNRALGEQNKCEYELLGAETSKQTYMGKVWVCFRATLSLDITFKKAHTVKEKFYWFHCQHHQSLLSCRALPFEEVVM